MPEPLGVVVGGSLSRGLEVRLGSAEAVESAKVGTFVTVQGVSYRFFGIISDLSLLSTDPRLPVSVGQADPAVMSVLSGTSAYAVAEVMPMLTVGVGEDAPAPAKSLPGHFAPVYRASASVRKCTASIPAARRRPTSSVSSISTIAACPASSATWTRPTAFPA